MHTPYQTMLDFVPCKPRPTAIKLRTRHHAANRYERRLPPILCAVDFYRDMGAQLREARITNEVALLVIKMLWDEYERAIELEGKEAILERYEREGSVALIEAVLNITRGA